MVARVAALGQRIGLGLALEIRAGHVVKQQVVLQLEELAQPLLQEDFQGLLVRQERVQRPIQPLLVDLLRRNTQQIGQGALGIEMLGDVQFARRIAEPAEHQHQGHQRPGNVFVARRGSCGRESRSRPTGRPVPIPAKARRNRGSSPRARARHRLRPTAAGRRRRAVSGGSDLPSAAALTPSRCGSSSCPR